jgi:hypothetical protein
VLVSKVWESEIVEVCDENNHPSGNDYFGKYFFILHTLAFHYKHGGRLTLTLP